MKDIKIHSSVLPARRLAGGALLTLIICSIALYVSGCQIFGPQAAKGTDFNHALHIKNEIECDTCHLPDWASGQAGDKFNESRYAGMPSMETCMACHEDKKDEITKKFFSAKDGKPAWADLCVTYCNVVFAHKTHIAKKLDCTVCHVGIRENTKVSDNLFPTMDTCTKCHGGKLSGDTCYKCHTETRINQTPESHKFNWKVVHGQIVKKGDDEIKKHKCFICHQESVADYKMGCSGCHRDEKPRDHTSYWRQRGHGVAVGIDRSRCDTCHKVDYCERCHKETAPRSHIPGWGEPQDRHCVTCHLPITTESCSMCHKSITHSGATKKSGSVPQHSSPSANCKACHTVIPHIDNGDSCNSCHK